MKLEPSTVIEGVVHVRLDRFADGRGFFMETFRQEWFDTEAFVQGNMSFSDEGVLRGLHYHLAQEDLWNVADGRAFVALVDFRESSPSFLQAETFHLEGPNSVYIPRGVAHGFYAETPLRMVYMVNNYYDGSDERGVAWNDPEVGVDWPTSDPVLSDRDMQNPYWSDVAKEDRP